MKVVEPGETIGVLGAGQLGRMFAIAARRLGYRVAVFGGDADSPTGQVSDIAIDAPFDDEQALTDFANQVKAVTYEFENVPTTAVQLLQERIPVCPGELALATSQHRFREKSKVQELGIQTAQFHLATSQAEVDDGVAKLNGSAIIKTVRDGYDGKGQCRVDALSEANGVWMELGEKDLIVEQIVDFTSEVSVVGVRGHDGDFRAYGPIWNHHADHILDISICPAWNLDEQVRDNAVEMTRTILDGLDVVGVMTVEFFVTSDGSLVVNELAPRPHNSGHLTIDAHVTCQFEQQVRAMCGLPLGSVEQRQPTAMANLLGKHIASTTAPQWQSMLSRSDVKLHLYGKTGTQSQRKVGHLTVLGSDIEAVEQSAREARGLLMP